MKKQKVKGARKKTRLKDVKTRKDANGAHFRKERVHMKNSKHFFSSHRRLKTFIGLQYTNLYESSERVIHVTLFYINVRNETRVPLHLPHFP